MEGQLPQSRCLSGSAMIPQQLLGELKTFLCMVCKKKYISVINKKNQVDNMDFNASIYTLLHDKTFTPATLKKR